MMFTSDEYQRLDAYFNGDVSLEQWFYTTVTPDWRQDYASVDELLDAVNAAIDRMDADYVRYL